MADIYRMWNVTTYTQERKRPGSSPTRHVSTTVQLPSFGCRQSVYMHDTLFGMDVSYTIHVKCLQTKTALELVAHII